VPQAFNLKEIYTILGEEILRQKLLSLCWVSVAQRAWNMGRIATNIKIMRASDCQDCDCQVAIKTPKKNGLRDHAY